MPVTDNSASTGLIKLMLENLKQLILIIMSNNNLFIVTIPCTIIALIAPLKGVKW